MSVFGSLMGTAQLTFFAFRMSNHVSLTWDLLSPGIHKDPQNLHQAVLIVLVAAACEGVLMIALSTPMALGKISPNGLYGFRTPKTMSSESIWYAANAYAGKALASAGLAMILMAAAFRICLPQAALPDTWLMALAFGIDLLPLALAVLFSVRKLKTL